MKVFRTKHRSSQRTTDTKFFKILANIFIYFKVLVPGQSFLFERNVCLEAHRNKAISRTSDMLRSSQTWAVLKFVK